MEDIDFWMDFYVGNSNKLQKLGLEGKISWALDVFTLSNLKFFNFKNVKNENVWVHTWGNNTSYANENDKNKDMFNLFEQIEKHETNLLAHQNCQCYITIDELRKLTSTHMGGGCYKSCVSYITNTFHTYTKPSTSF